MGRTGLAAQALAPCILQFSVLLMEEIGTHCCETHQVLLEEPQICLVTS
jgi:hypothetical protein